MKKLLTILSLCLIPLLFKTRIYALDEDFLVNTDTEIIYNSGSDYVTVKTEYTRIVKNKAFYLPATGEKIFHIPDAPNQTEEQNKTAREYKIGSTTVTNSNGNEIEYSVDERDFGEGIYIVVPNYKTTTSTSPYTIYFTYNTQDLVNRNGKYVNIFGTSLPAETEFFKKDEESGTVTRFDYNLAIVVDSKIAPLAKVFPAFTTEEKDKKTYYKFSQTDRIGNSPTIEFGTSAIYRFELEYSIQKTDNFTSKKYSDIFQALSTNIVELSLPKEFSETQQKVYFDKINPAPKLIYKDEEGNILASFEIPANIDSKIHIIGYITVNQDEWEEEPLYPDSNFFKYLEDISKGPYLKKYLKATKYWQSKDDLIVEYANNLKSGLESTIDIIKADYRFVNEKLEYDTNKATSENERIGAKEALLGGSSVCMEYADLMIAILRAQGIPARAAIGYTNLAQEEFKEQVRHQWVQVWIPEYGWFSIDPTFESENMKMGQMIDRVLWEVFNDDSLSNIKIYSANKVHDLSADGYQIKVFGVNDNIELENLRTYTDLVPNNEIPSADSSQNILLLNTLLKTTILGKALIVTLPVLLVLGVLTGIFLLVTVIFKKVKKGKSKKTT